MVVVGRAQKPLTRRLPASLEDLPQVGEGYLPQLVGGGTPSLSRIRPIGSQHFRFRTSWSRGREKDDDAGRHGSRARACQPTGRGLRAVGPAGFRLAYLLTGDRALAEDLVQEAFLRFVGRLQHLRDPEVFDVYLRRTIVNLSKDTFRRRTIERSYLERRTAELREGHIDRDVAAYESTRTRCSRLPPRQRAAIVLRSFGSAT